ncbi:hypothetical protein QF046_003362 [Microbacterium sp. W4I4]|uniref:hypothetical protein n=1 Tax=Microbacterium sp. W4I4 TaxID=3042295 RepID=UPI002784871B|nr:hypothetical protein [Microbacterium sp. W4I4]MDQ0615721.1 hypothetical protein [Microbacterium sp. W4I4]
MTDAVKTRMLWTDLPTDLVARIERILGSSVVSAISQAEGFSPGSADRVATAAGRRAFVKTAHRGHNEGAYDLHRREADVMRLLPPEVSAPALLGSVVTDDWAVLVVEDIEGRHPGRAGDGSEIVAVLDAFATLPRLTEGAGAAIRPAADEFMAEQDSWRMIEEGSIRVPEWAVANRARLRAAAEGVLDVVAGEHLQHLDGRADNVLMDAEGRAWLIDWPWAAVGARWLDGLFYVFDARVRGESFDAEETLRSHALFEGVDDADIDAVLAGVAGNSFVKASLPAPPGMPTIRAFQHTWGVEGTRWLEQRWG